MKSWTTDDEKANEVAKSIGTALLTGFLVMLALDEIVKIAGPNDAKEVAEKKESKSPRKARSPNKGKSPTKEKKTTKDREKTNSTAFMTTIALCIHSLTEGVATGASWFSK